MESIHICENRTARTHTKKDLYGISQTSARSALRFHQSFPVYSVTPLVKLNHFAESSGVDSIYIKDESYRFGLNSFKVLGSSYAVGNYLAMQLGQSIEKITYSDLVSQQTKQQLGKITFITATDGNHGLGLAWTAAQLQQQAIVLMPRGSSPNRLKRIQNAGAKAFITDFNYDGTVRMAAKLSSEHGWVLIQDTAWPSYEEIPSWIMQGYQTMSCETFHQLNGVWPTHIFIQAGVGSLAASVVEFFYGLNPSHPPILIVVEPNKACPIYQTAFANDGRLHTVTGDLNTIMAGLACGEPSTIAWDILKERADFFLEVPDYTAAQGMRILGNPIRKDPRIVSGESGAAAFGAVTEILRNPAYHTMKKTLKLNSDSVLLFFNSEGDTDPDHYRRIVWDGAYAQPNEAG